MKAACGFHRFCAPDYSDSDLDLELPAARAGWLRFMTLSFL